MLVGCQDASLDWRFELESGVVGAETIGAFVRTGSCSETAEPAVYFFARGETSPVVLTPLDRGTHCFEVAAFDADCREVGRGEQMAVLPPDGFEVILVVVRPSSSDDVNFTCASYLASLGDGGA